MNTLSLSFSLSHFFYFMTGGINLRCDEKITKEALKVGVVSEGTWGPSTQWHHLQCTIFQIDRAEDVMGFNDLEDALQVTNITIFFLSLELLVNLFSHGTHRYSCGMNRGFASLTGRLSSYGGRVAQRSPTDYLCSK